MTKLLDKALEAVRRLPPQACRIQIDRGRAVGVEWAEGRQLHRARTDREVILSAGALQSPQLLQLSGI